MTVNQPSGNPNPFASALAQAISPAEIDAFTPLGYTPHDRQKVFHQKSKERLDAILFGGARAGGKSKALLMDAIWNAVNFPNMRIACVRRSYPELEESFLAELSSMGYAKALDAKWNNTQKTLRFPNGALINFTFAENEVDISKMQGGQYQLICVDEAGLMAVVVLERLEEQLRSGDRNIPVIGMRFSSNPMGASHSYLKKRFISPTDYGKHLAYDDRGRQSVFVPSKYYDNPYINEGYKAVLESISDPQRRAAMLEGDWDVVEGSYFSQWNRALHVVPPFDLDNPYKLPAEWQRFCGIDWGFRAPYAALWAAKDEDGRLWVYDEIYATGVDTTDQALWILQRDEVHGDTEIIRAADPSMWGNRGTPYSIADTYAMAGCALTPADNDRKTGWDRVHHYLNMGPACEYHRSIDPDIERCPLLHVFDGNCPMFVETTPALQRSKTKPDDADTDGDDHLQDCVRYLCMMVNSTAMPVFTDARPNGLRRYQSGQPLVEDQANLVAGKFAGSLAIRL